MQGTQDVATAPRFGGGGYNITLSSITKSLLSVPSRMLSRMRRADEILAKEAMAKRAAAAAQTTWTSQAAQTSHAAQAVQASPPPPLPVSKWAFFTSWYMLGLVLVALLVHRIQNVVVPSRAPNPQHRRDRGLVRRAYDAFLPIDLERTTTRFALHSVSLYLIMRVLVIWFAIVLQTSQLYPMDSSVYMVRQLGQYTQRLSMGNVCWDTFVAICAVTCAETFTRGLDGLGNSFLTSPASSSPFHLLSYSFMLHIYSTSGSHTFRPDGLPSRPDKHVCIALIIPIIHVAIQHIISIRRRWSTHRFWPSAIRSLLSLAHFHLTLISFTKYMDYIPFFPQIVAASNRGIPPEDATFPQLQLMPNVLETFLIFTTVLTILLNVLTQLLLTGRVDKPLLGLGLITGPDGWSTYIPYDEDWSVFIGRVGTASLEATGLRGWGNELGAVLAPAAPPRHQGRIQMSTSGVVRIIPGVSQAGKPLKGLRNEVKDVDIGAGPAPGFFASLAALPFVDWRWVWQLWEFVKVAGGVVRGAGRLAWALMRGEGGRILYNKPPQGTVVPAVRDAEDEDDGEGQEVELYRRFLTGDSFSDADDDEPAQWDSEEEAEDEEDEDSDDGQSEQDAEALELFMDLRRSRARSTTPTPEASAAPLFVAHMMSEGSSPLTRRQYLGLALTANMGGGEVATGARPSTVSADDDETRRTCVICTFELREIICWPCRCLAMCNGCRESLAAQASASKHRCPCCRRRVEGYSKIFIP
ncbi:hypothetical protein BD626DRAFT_633340 [Schizophyllum amplum]|uniref:RING-type domain-containing protein n=1 Tax=Schizophyllum amplum TaxID=97359 RepID=A0A550C346_9AGAR|nr:hypothetical protein BD626DRAFT_633340 [Auriculariopsis ampla]